MDAERARSGAVKGGRLCSRIKVPGSGHEHANQAFYLFTTM